MSKLKSVNVAERGIKDAGLMKEGHAEGVFAPPQTLAPRFFVHENGFPLPTPRLFFPDYLSRCP
jgi:hypothetical protein